MKAMNITNIRKHRDISYFPVHVVKNTEILSCRTTNKRWIRNEHLNLKKTENMKVCCPIKVIAKIREV
jgi:hypothetical protein